MAEHPRIALRWLVEALENLDRCNRRVVGLLRRSTRGRLTSFLLEEADEEGWLGLTQGEIAGLVGVSRQALNRAMVSLREHGIIETRRGRIRLLDPAAAERIAAETHVG